MAKDFDKKKKNQYKGKGNGKPKDRKPKDYKPKEVDSPKEGGNTTSYDNMCTNEIGWYNKKANLFDSATRIPFNQIMGREVDLIPTLNDWYDGGKAVPGVMSIDYVPGIGIATNASDAPNRAFQAMYTALISKTSTSKLDFQAANLATMIIVEQSLAQNIAIVKRALKTATLYSPSNMYYPRALLTAMGFDAQDTIDNLGEYIWQINNLIRDFNVFRIPNFIDTFKRHYFLAKSVFADQASTHAQVYLFRPVVGYVYSDLGKWDAETESYDGAARACAYRLFEKGSLGRDYRISDLLDFIKLQITSIRDSSDYTLINGTLSRAFGTDAFVVIDEMMIGEIQPVLVDDNMSYQIHNLVMAGDAQNSTEVQPNITTQHARCDVSWDIYADYIHNVVKYQPSTDLRQGFEGVALALQPAFILNTFEQSITPEQIMEYTRLMSIIDSQGGIESMGTEFITQIHIWTNDYFDGYMETIPTDVSPAYSCVSEAEVSGNPDATKFILDLAKFHKAPRFTYAVTEGSSNYVLGVTGDLDFFTMISRSALTKLHDTALLSIFDADASMAKVVK